MSRSKPRASKAAPAPGNQPAPEGMPAPPGISPSAGNQALHLPVAPPTQTTDAIVATLRQIQAEGGRDAARLEMIAALCGCCLHSMELDGLAATLKLLADAALILERGYGGALVERAATVH